MDESTFRKRFLVRAGMGALLLFILVWAFVKGDLSSRGFVLAALFWSLVMFAAFYALIRSLQRSTEEVRKQRIAAGVPPQVIERDRYVKGIRAWKRIIAYFSVLFVLGMLSSQDVPLMVRGTAAAFYAFFLVGCVRSLIRAQKKLKQLKSDNPGMPTDVN